jgi:hypothetical protein
MYKALFRRSISAVLTILLLTPAAYASVAPGSIQFNGTQSAVTDLNFNSVPGTGNFTYEFWFYVDDASRPNQGLMNTRSGNSKDGIDAQVNPNSETTGILGVSYRSNWLFYSPVGTISSKTWYHLALVRTSVANLNVYLDGVLQISLTLDGDGRDFTSTHLVIGAIGGISSINARLTGNISNFRYSKSVIYSAAFTPVRTTLEATADTKVLLKSLNDSSFLDNTGSDPAIFTNNGGAVSSALSQSIIPLTDKEIAANALAAQKAAEAKREAEKQAARNEILNLVKTNKDINLELFIKAEIYGVTAANIAVVQGEIAALPQTSRADLSQVLKIARKYEVVGKIASDQFASVYSESLIEIGLIPKGSKHKAALTAAVKKLPPSDRSSYASIQKAINAEMAEIQVRKDRLANVIARNASRYTK